MTTENTTKRQVARALYCLLEANRQSWEQYGPRSELALSQPHNEAAHAVWLNQRRTVIAPNNRKLAAALEALWVLFEVDEMTTIWTFLDHAYSYEKWIRGEIPYDEVEPFPEEFEYLMRGLAKQN